LPLPLPAPPVLTLTAADLLEVPAALLRRPDAAWPEVPPDLPVIDPGDVTPEAALLRRLVARGAGQGEAGGAGGLAGVVYDNRDRGHYSLPAGLFPQIARLAYGPDLVDNWRRSASHVDKILKGANPAELPVEQPVKFELLVNLQAARAIGLVAPRSLLLRADEVIG
jgi:hypothetical protein